MTFFQNPFPWDFKGMWTLGDRQYSQNFSIGVNSGRGDEIFMAWTEPNAANEYNLSGTDADSNDNSILTFIIAMSQNDYRDWASIAVNIDGAAPASTTVREIVTALNAATTWNSHFTASVGKFDSGRERVVIKQDRPVVRMHSYIGNTGAETLLRLNARAGVAELPTYFHRHDVFVGFTPAERLSFTDGVNQLIELDPQDAGGASNVDDDIISNAVNHKGISLGLDPSTVQGDWQLLQGGSGIFQFTSGPSGNAVSTTETVLEYPAGAVVGDLAKQTVTEIDASSVIIAIYELPYTLTSSDLITPP